MSLHLGLSPELDQLTEIGRSGLATNISFEKYLSDHPLEWTSYFAGTGQREDPRVVRRRDLGGDIDRDSPNPLLYDQIFNGQRWVYTWDLWDIGTAHDDYRYDYAEISEGEALRLVLMRLSQQLSIRDPR